MKTKPRTILSRIFLIWLGCVLVTCVLIPLFQKSEPDVESPVSNLSQQGPKEYVRCIDDNREALLRRLQVIDSAREELLLSAYYLGGDESGTDVMSALMDASRRGVRIRILVDGFCSFTTNLPASHPFQALVNQENVEAKIYNPMGILFPGRNNYRMHDKYLIADRSVYILGGRNIRNVSLGDYQEKKDIDRDVLVYSDSPEGSVSQLAEYFEAVWNQKVSRPVKPRKVSPQVGQELLDHFEILRQQFPVENTDFRTISMEADSVRLLANPIGARNKEPLLWAQLVKIMKQGTDIEVQTPYMILNRRMYEDLNDVAGDRQATIITNAPESGANPLGCADFLNNKKRLLQTGASICEYAGAHSAHVKTVVVDDRISLIGSFNFDMRSAYLDTELMLLIDSPELNAQLRRTNDGYIASSRCSSRDSVTLGENFTPPSMGPAKRVIYGVLRIVSLPIRQLL